MYHKNEKTNFFFSTHLHSWLECSVFLLNEVGETDVSVCCGSYKGTVLMRNVFDAKDVVRVSGAIRRRQFPLVKAVWPNKKVSKQKRENKE